MRKLNKSYIVIRKFPFVPNYKEIFCAERLNEIETCKSEKTKNDKLYAWYLLQDSFKDIFNVEPEKIDFTKNKNGKWTCDLCNFSISHSGDLVAVVLSNADVGIDIQEYKIANIKKAIIAEKCEENLEEIALFSKKEAIYKAIGDSEFVPNKISVKEFPIFSFDVWDNKQKYVLNVYSGINIKLNIDERLSYKLNNK